MKENIELVQGRIEKAAAKIGKTAVDIKLIAVTKTHPLKIIETALQNGIKFIAENKVQDSEDKIPKLKGKYTEFHFIGHLQSNKIKRILSLQPDLIHSIDKFSTARKISQYLGEHQLPDQNILIEVNTSREDSKFGVPVDDVINLVKQISKLPNIKIIGLMTVGMFTSDEEILRSCFQILKQLFDDIKQKNIPNIEMKYLSMGMSNDYEIAIEEGSNMIRVGTAIFGTREYKGSSE